MIIALNTSVAKCWRLDSGKNSQKGVRLMRLPNKDEMKGKLNKAKGAAKESIGRTVGDREMENSGAHERRSVTARENLSRARRKVGDALKDLGDAVRK